MKKSTCLGYFCLIAVLLVSTGFQHARAQKKGFKQVRRTTFLTNLSGQTDKAQKVRASEETAKAGQLTTGDTASVAPDAASKAKAVRRDPSMKVTLADRAGSKSAAPQMEMSGGLEAARAPVSAREGFGGKP